MTELETLHDTYDRIDAGEPIRILIGHVLHRSTEIELAPGYAEKLRAELLRGVGERIIELTPPDPSPAAPALTATQTGAL